MTSGFRCIALAGLAVIGGGCRLYYPRMIGWGGNIVALMPHGLTGIRLAKSSGAPDNADVDTAGMARVADGLVKFCD
jgi:hypothetical protein